MEDERPAMQDEPPAEAAEPKPKRVKKDLPTGIVYNASHQKQVIRHASKVTTARVSACRSTGPFRACMLPRQLLLKHRLKRSGSGTLVRKCGQHHQRPIETLVVRCVRPTVPACLIHRLTSQLCVTGTNATCWMDGRQEEVEPRRAAVEEGQGRGRRSRQQPEEPRQQASPAGQAVGRPVGDTVPLPAQRCSACKHCIVDYLSDTCGMCAEIAPLLPENRAGPAGSTRVLPPVPVALAPASPNLISSGPRVRGWLQREIDEGLCEAPVAQVPVLCARAA